MPQGQLLSLRTPHGLASLCWRCSLADQGRSTGSPTILISQKSNIKQVWLIIVRWGCRLLEQGRGRWASRCWSRRCWAAAARA